MNHQPNIMAFENQLFVVIKVCSLNIWLTLITFKCALIKVIGIRPLAPVLNKVHLKVSEHEMLTFSVRKEIIKNDDSLVVILLSKVVENEFLQTV